MKNLFNHLKTDWYKYLLELIVITAGILGAYALNAWNESRLDVKKEQLILHQLHNEYQQNLTQIEYKIALRNYIIEHCFKILDMFNAPSEASSDSLRFSANFLSLMATFDPISSDVIVSGNIRLIRNPRLKELLQQWSTDVIQVQEEEQKWVRICVDQWMPLINKLGLTRLMHSSLQLNEEDGRKVVKLMLIDSSKYQIPRPVPIPISPPDILTMLENKEFDGIVTWAIAINQQTNDQSYILREKIAEILQLIESEI